MKAKVLRTYIDKVTNKSVEKGNTIEVTNDRFKEINSTSYGALLEEVKEVKAKKGKAGD